jgi:hypothetical protein
MVAVLFFNVGGVVLLGSVVLLGAEKYGAGRFRS